MIYVFDTSSFIVMFENYYLDAPAFKSFKDLFDDLVNDKRIVSVREAKREIDDYPKENRLKLWCKAHRDIFLTPTTRESEFINEIFVIRHFRHLVKIQKALKHSYVADPFVIAKAKYIPVDMFAGGSCVVTEEADKPHAGKIPNVCRYFGIDCINVVEFLQRESQ